MLSFARSNVFVTPKWPVWTWFSISARSDFGITIFWPRKMKPFSNERSMRWFQYSRIHWSQSDWVSGQTFKMTFCNVCICRSCSILVCIVFNLLSVIKSCCKTVCTCKSRPVTKFGYVAGKDARDKKSLTGMSFPLLWNTSMLYFWSCRSIRIKRGGAAESVFFMIAEMGLWSECAITCLPYVNWFQRFNPKTIARSSFSIGRSHLQFESSSLTQMLYGFHLASGNNLCHILMHLLPIPAVSLDYSTIKQDSVWLPAWSFQMPQFGADPRQILITFKEFP